ncbi:intradiol ring-cleavage dioxygenase [Zhouia amylolytica]|nr:intradiol ring-cleavage dioxygenase [Zhouia amylolytica]
MFFISTVGCSQDKMTPQLIGGPCEGCEAVFEYAGTRLNATDTLPDFNNDGPRLRVSGTVYLPDGKSPAKDVILYVYHTDQDGVYPAKGTETGWGKRHGYIRSWIKTNNKGQYTFYTLKPGVYPNRSAAAHIHLTILEPNGKYYWVENYLFEGDSLLKAAEKEQLNPRGGGSGILTLTKEGDLLVGKRDLILGRNVPGYSDKD